MPICQYPASLGESGPFTNEISSPQVIQDAVQECQKASKSCFPQCSGDRVLSGDLRRSHGRALDKCVRRAKREAWGDIEGLLQSHVRG